MAELVASSASSEWKSLNTLILSNSILNHQLGGLAQLARASALHAEGQRFESVILHAC